MNGSMKVAFAATKGGAGKTTTLLHCGVASGSFLIDCDPQGSAAQWWQSREAALPALVTSSAERLPHALGMASTPYVLVDTPPQVGDEIRHIVDLVDYVVVVTRPSVLDLRAIASTVEIVRGLKKPACILLNACPAGRGSAEASIVGEARRALAVYGIGVCPVAITQRAAFSHAITAGQGVTEYEPNGAAAGETTRLWSWLCRSVPSSR
jgi:chromosome partitioning protein